jgi:hypothetical protein
VQDGACRLSFVVTSRMRGSCCRCRGATLHGSRSADHEARRIGLRALEARRIDGYLAMGHEKKSMQKVLSAMLEATRRMLRKMATKS